MLYIGGMLFLIFYGAIFLTKFLSVCKESETVKEDETEQEKEKEKHEKFSCYGHLNQNESEATHNGNPCLLLCRSL